MRKTAEKVKNLFLKRPDLLITDGTYQLASLRHAPEMADVLWEVKKAFAQGILPEVCTKGACATYFLKDCEHRPIAVFKQDNYLREVAAYRLDHQRFAGVPPTVIATLESSAWGGFATGSCQYFVPNSVTVVDVHPHEQEMFSAACVRRIASLDIRTMNDDRHTSNILVVDGRQRLIPIDHGFILPNNLSDIYFDWLNWAQATTPFNDVELSYIAQLDPEEDRRILIDELSLEEKRANRLYVATILLKRGVVRKLSSADLGNIISRKRFGLLRKENVISRFERLIATLLKRNPQNWTLFSSVVYEEVERTLDAYEKATVECTDPAAHR